MITELVNVTPNLARKWLMVNSHNRPLRPSHVRTLFESFSRGEYVTTHQGIAFDENGNIADGQHRLTAISRMPDDCVFPMLVTYGLDRGKAFKVIDTTQAKRSTGDALNWDRGFSQTAGFITRLYLGVSQITPTLVEPIGEAISANYHDLISYCGTTTRVWSTAPVRSAAVLKMAMGSAEYVKSVYSAMVRSEFDAMPHIGQVLYRSYLNGAHAGAGDLFLRCLKMFDQKNADLSHIKIIDTAKSFSELRPKIAAMLFTEKKK